MLVFTGKNNNGIRCCIFYPVKAVVIYTDFMNKMVQYFSDNETLGARVETGIVIMGVVKQKPYEFTYFYPGG